MSPLLQSFWLICPGQDEFLYLQRAETRPRCLSLNEPPIDQRVGFHSKAMKKEIPWRQRKRRNEGGGIRVNWGKFHFAGATSLNDRRTKRSLDTLIAPRVGSALSFSKWVWIIDTRAIRHERSWCFCVLTRLTSRKRRCSPRQCSPARSGPSLRRLRWRQAHRSQLEKR